MAMPIEATHTPWTPHPPSVPQPKASTPASTPPRVTPTAHSATITTTTTTHPPPASTATAVSMKMLLNLLSNDATYFANGWDPIPIDIISLLLLYHYHMKLI